MASSSHARRWRRAALAILHGSVHKQHAEHVLGTGLCNIWTRTVRSRRAPVETWSRGPRSFSWASTQQQKDGQQFLRTTYCADVTANNHMQGTSLALVNYTTLCSQVEAWAAKPLCRAFVNVGMKITSSRLASQTTEARYAHHTRSHRKLEPWAI